MGLHWRTAREYHKASSAGSFALILGNEGNGVSQSILTQPIKTSMCRFTGKVNH